MKNLILATTTFLLAGAMILPVQLSAQTAGQSGRPSVEQNNLDDRGRFGAGQRGMRPTPDNRIIMQLDGITGDQRKQISELYNAYRAHMDHMTSLLRNEQIDRDEFTSRRREHYQSHQDDLRNILSEEQWQQLQSLRSERRSESRYQQTSYHVNRTRLIAQELDLDNETTDELISIVESRREMMEEARTPGDIRFRGRVNPKDIQRDIFKARLEYQDQMRELLGDEAYAEFHQLRSQGGRQSGLSPAFGADHSGRGMMDSRRQAPSRSGESGRPAIRGCFW